MPDSSTYFSTNKKKVKTLGLQQRGHHPSNAAISMEEARATASYLTDAAYLLNLAAPETSAHFLDHRNRYLASINAAPLDVERQQVCGACGNIILRDQTSSSLQLEPTKVQFKTRRAPVKNGKSIARDLNTFKKVDCELCGRYSKKPMETRPRPVRRKATPTIASKSGHKAENEALPKSSSSSNSKKRAKSRKAGLQALLSGQQQKQQSSGPKLSDFMG